MEHKLKSLLEILEDDKKKKNNVKKSVEDLKKEKIENFEKVFNGEHISSSCEIKESSSFEYVKPKYLVQDCRKALHLKSYEGLDEDTYFKYIRKNDSHGKETVELYEIIRNYSNDFSEYDEDTEETPIDLNRVQKLIDKGADINFVNNYEYNDTCLTQAVQCEDINLIKLLLENGANPNIEQYFSSDNNPLICDILWLAIEHHDSEVEYERLFAATVEVCDADLYEKRSPKHYFMVDFVNEELEDEERTIAIKLLEPYGFAEEDFDRNQSSNRNKSSDSKNNNKKSKSDKELDQKFDDEFNIPENL